MNNNVKEIITDAAKLDTWCKEIDPQKEGKLTQEIILALKSTMREYKLDSLTAPQIGYNRRIFCMRFGENDYRTFINPMIENNTDFHFAKEKCSSIPGKEFIRPRFGSIRLFYVTPLSKYEARNIVGRAAVVVQHCIDHLNGLLLSDVGLEIDELWYNATEDERAEVLKAYSESLDIKQKALDTEISETEELKEINDAAKFMASVQSGETQIDNSLNENSDE